MKSNDTISTFRPGRLFRLLFLTAVMVFVANTATAWGNLEVTEQESIAPLSIPVDESGNAPDKVGLVRMGLVVDASFGGTETLEEFKLELLGVNNPENQVKNLYVYFEQQDGGTTNDGKYDPDENKLVKTVTDIDPASWPLTLDSWQDKDGNPFTITIREFLDGGTAYIYVAFDFVAGTIDTTATVGCNIYEIFDSAGEIQNPAVNDDPPVNLDHYLVTISGSTEGDLLPDTAGPGDTVTALKLDFGVDDDSLFSAPTAGGYAQIDMIRFRNTGTATTADFDETSAVIVFRDANGNETLDAGEKYGEGPMVFDVDDEYAVVGMNTPILIYDTYSTYYAAVQLSGTPTHGKTVGLQVMDPSDTENVSFADGIDDVGGGKVADEYYNQQGYITSTDATPAGLDTFTIITDPDPPTVSNTNPDTDATLVSISITQVKVFFSEPMLEATVEDPNNFSLVVKQTGTPVSGTAAYESGNRALVFTLGETLAYNTTYTATVVGGPTGVTDLVGNELYVSPTEQDYSWDFTAAPQFPDFDEPIAIKNRIGTGADDQALIFVPQPPGGAGTRMSVQAFTTTGKLVRTFYKNVPWSVIGTSPIAWDGTNDRGQSLGPGLYFIQIRASDYKRVLKVMIVR